jgi:hypothetical protein
MKFYDEAFRAAAAVTAAFKSKELEGWPADNGVSLPWIAQMAINAGAGDHLEIGTSFGASAITVALAKKAAGVPGKVYCVDPYPAKREVRYATTSGNDPKPATVAQARKNIAKAEVDVEIIQAPSKPFPKILDEKHPSLFVSAYVDGDHLGEMPYHDLMECAKRTQFFIGTDNYEEGYPDVVDASHKFMLDNEWRLYFKNFIFVAFRRVQPPRNALLSSRLEHL